MSTMRNHSNRICKSTKLSRTRPSSTSKLSGTQIKNLRVTPSSASKQPDSIKRTLWRIWWKRLLWKQRRNSRRGRLRKYRVSRWRGGQGRSRHRRIIGWFTRRNNFSSRDRQQLRVPCRDMTWWVKGAWKANKARRKYRQPVYPEEG